MHTLTRQQAERIDGLTQKQKETDENVSAIQGDLESVKTVMDGRLSAMEESLTGLRGFQAESMKTLKQELREELLRDLSTHTAPGTRVSSLRPMAPPFVPTDAVASVAATDGTGMGSSTPTTSGGGTPTGSEDAGTLSGIPYIGGAD